MINKQYVWDIYDASTDNGGNLQLWKDNGTNAQKFMFTYNSDGYYTITNANSNKAIECAGGKSEDGTNIQQYTSNNTNAQKWKITSAGNGYYTFQCKGNGKMIDVYGGTASNGKNIQLYTSNGSKAQKFALVKTQRKQGASDNTNTSEHEEVSSSLLFPLKGDILTSSSQKTNGQRCDYKASAGTPVYAPANGKVAFRQSYAIAEKKLASYGNNIVFTSSDGVYEVRCAHLKSFNGVDLKYTSSLSYRCSASDYKCKTITLRIKNVKQGDLLGYTGMTGNASGPHLHLEVKKNGKAVNPISVFQIWD